MSALAAGAGQTSSGTRGDAERVGKPQHLLDAMDVRHRGALR